MVAGALQVVRGVIAVAVALITGDWSKAWSGLRDIVMGLRVRWIVDGLVFGDDPDPDGTEYLVTSESGWSSSPPARTEPGHTGRTRPRSGRQAEHRLAALASDPARLVELRCTEETGDLSALVARSDQTRVAIDPGGYSLSFALGLRAPDPRKYADPLDTDGGLDYGTKGGLDFGAATGLGHAIAVNPGTADSAPLLRLVGPLTGPVVITRTDTGATLTYLDSLPAGQFVTIDVATRTVLLNGATQPTTPCPGI
jgi:hypothetical protein